MASTTANDAITATERHTRRWPDAELRALVESVMDAEASAPLGVYLFGPDEPGAALGLHIEREVFGDVFGNTPEQLNDEYLPYHHVSIFACVLDHRRRLPAGVMRVILPSSVGLKSLNDTERIWGIPAEALFAANDLPYDPERTWDIATLAVDPEFRRSKTGHGLVTLGLAQAISMLTVQLETRCAVSIMDVEALEVIRATFYNSTPFAGIEPRPYLDSPASVPVWTYHQQWDDDLKRNDELLYEILRRGTGLEAAVAPADWQAGAATCLELMALADSACDLRSRDAGPAAARGGAASRAR